MKHTKGKWEIKDHGSYKQARLITCNKIIICLAPEEYEESASHFEANAKLIAAAPELLESCQAVLDEWHSKDSNFNKKEPKYLEPIRQIIKKATE